MRSGDRRCSKSGGEFTLVPDGDETLAVALEIVQRSRGALGASFCISA
jgi:hypothetical protein